MEDKFYYMLAPIENMTDSCFRSICIGADMTFTEMASLEALAKNNPFALERIKLYDDTLCMVQIIGQKEKSLEIFLSGFKPEKGFRGFNLNLGCPDPDAVSAGLGCAMMKRVSKIKRMIEMIKGYGYGANIKMRLGLNQFEKDNKAYLNLIENVDADFFIVHARHGKESYKDKADWSVFPECVKTGKNIIANGNIGTKEDVLKMKGCRGVMIGRAAVFNPLIFAELKGLAIPSRESVKAEYERLLKERHAHPKYSKHIFKHIGNDFSENS
ncbi:MAG: tRNA-dihydrouridine synthase family protein [Minisyncoccia bacterium]